MVFSTITSRISYHPKLSLKEYVGFLKKSFLFIYLSTIYLILKIQETQKIESRKKKCAWPNCPETATLNTFVSFPQKLFSEQERFVCLLFIKQVLFFLWTCVPLVFIINCSRWENTIAEWEVRGVVTSTTGIVCACNHMYVCMYTYLSTDECIDVYVYSSVHIFIC